VKGEPICLSGKADFCGKMDVKKEGRRVERLMEQILFELKEMRVDLNEVKQGQKQLESDIRELRAGQEQLESDVRELHLGQQQLKSDVRTLQEAVAELQEGQVRVEQTIDKLSQSIIDNLAPYFDQITEHIDDGMKRSTKNCMDDRNPLYRSLAQETELKDLKRMTQNSS
jgi:outer membrane murein-binding lipoprotein Lpp